MIDRPRLKGVFSLAGQDLNVFKQKMLNRAKRFGIFLYLDSNGYKGQGGTYECLAGMGTAHVFTPSGADLPDQLYTFQQQQQDWLFGHISYELKNVLEPRLHSQHPLRHNFPTLQFFVPEIVAGVNAGSHEVFIASLSQDPEVIFNGIMETDVPESVLPHVTFQPRVSKEDYLEKIAILREHIRNGDCYEINFCTEAFSKIEGLDTAAVFNQLNKRSPAPFSAFYGMNDQYLMCASPERYLRKSGDKIISQPIKGTARRSVNLQEDEQLKAGLQQSEKERAENVMIVDLVRNDLARSCEKGSIQVDELFGIYTFPQVHQMISTVSGTLQPGRPFTDAIKYSFPMGSMTGAPKIKVMELIEQYEASGRELFAGSVGYIDPSGDFDFNVVIRSLFYNARTSYLSYQTGGAITWDSDAQGEWDEMRLKAAAMEKLFS